MEELKSKVVAHTEKGVIIMLNCNGTQPIETKRPILRKYTHTDVHLNIFCDFTSIITPLIYGTYSNKKTVCNDECGCGAS